MGSQLSKPDSNECLDIMLTDFKLHASKVRKPNSLGRRYVKAIHNGGKGNRAYSNDMKIDDKNLVTFSIGLEMEHLYDLARKKGKKYVRIFTKRDGLPVFLGQDSVERLNALKKKVLRKTSKSVL